MIAATGARRTCVAFAAGLSALVASGACSLGALDGYATGGGSSARATSTGGASTTTGSSGTVTSTSTSTSTTAGSSGASTGTSTSGSTSSGGCAGSATCVPPAPLGWMGPIVLEISAGTPQCSNPDWANPVPSVEGSTGTTTVPTCGACSCAGPTATCPTSAQVSAFSNSTCSASSQPLTFTTTKCTTVFGVVDSVQGSRTAANATCSGSTPMPTSPSTFTEQALGCSATVAPTTCTDNGVCATIPLCVYAPGTPPCPPAFPDRTMVYGGIADGYTCTPCDCTAVGVTCAPTVELFYAACSGAPLVSGALDGVTCVVDNTADPVGYAKLSSAGTPTGGSCQITGGGALTGSATGTNPVTVCCSS